MSKSARKKAGVKLDLVNAEIFDKVILLQNTNSGYYILSFNDIAVPINLYMFTNCDLKEKEKMVIKVHKKFVHPTARRLKEILEDAGV